MFMCVSLMYLGLLERDGEMWADGGLEAEAGSRAVGRWCRKRERERVGNGGGGVGGWGGVQRRLIIREQVIENAGR